MKWGIRPLKDVAEIIMGQSPKSSSYNDKGNGLPFFQGKAEFGHKYPAAQKYCTEPIKTAKDQDILLSVRAPVGAVNIATEKCCIGRGLAAIRILKGQIDYLYLYYYFVSKKRDLESIGVGSTFQAITKSDIENLSIPLPPLHIQKQIAQILDEADALIQKRKQAIAKLDELVQSVFLEMFGDPVINPKGFEICPLNEICDVRDGTHDSPQYVSTGYPLVTSKNVLEDGIDFDNVNLISEQDYYQINKRSKVDKGDILMPMIGTIGNPVIVETDRPFAIKNVALLKFANATRVNNIYVKTLLTTHYFDYLTRGKNRGGTQRFISLGDIRSFPIPVPPRILQDMFSERYSLIKRQKSLMQKQLAKLEENFNSLLQRAFKGELQFFQAGERNDPQRGFSEAISAVEVHS